MIQMLAQAPARMLKLTPSLDPVLDFWRSLQPSDPLHALAQVLLPQIEAAPELAGPLRPEALQKHSSLVAALVSCLLPAALQRWSFAALATPATYEVHWATPRFREELLDADGQLRARVHVEGMDWEYLRELFHFLLVARRFYAKGFPFEKSVRLETDDGQLQRSFQLRAHFEHMDFRAPQPLPVISDEAWSEIGNDLDDLELWRKHVPLEEFELYGLVVYEATEITEEVSLSAIKQELVQPAPLRDPETFARIQQRFRTLLGVPDVQILVLGYMDEMVLDLTASGGWSEAASANNKLTGDCRVKLRQGSCTVIEDLASARICTPMLADARNAGARSLLWMPLLFEGSPIGLLVCTSKQPDMLNNLTVHRIRELLPLLALAVRRAFDAFDQQVEGVIRERFTALHPAVEWKFRRQALEVVRSADVDLVGQDIVFHDVYPLFGASDVRNSTVIRNAAIQADLSLQLRLALEAVEVAEQARPLSFLASRRFRLGQWLARLETGLDSGDESRIVEFLRNDVEDLFPTLEAFSPEAASAVASYRGALDSELGMVYRQRRDYEHSMNLLKERTAHILSERQVQAQGVFPHYFELHKSDGIDHTMYLGPSIHPEGTFEPLFLRNLRLWQLETMLEIAGRSRDWAKDMKCVLESAHLLLVQDRPLSIRFSQDEKQFNVDGAYNARYEILKKRLDKAEVRETGERLTQPGKVAIVYSHPREAAEYRDYLEYLQSSGVLQGEIEELEIAPLQGVVGLRALRVTAA